MFETYIIGYKFIHWYLPLYIAIGVIAISIFTVGLNLVLKREKQLHKRIMLTDCRKVDEYASDIFLTFILSIPLIIILFFEAIIVFKYQFEIQNLLVLVSTFITTVVSVTISYFIFNLINNSKIASPLQLAVFGFSLFSLGIIMPYPMLNDNIMSFIKLTPYIM